MTSSLRFFLVIVLVCLVPAAYAANWEKPTADLAKQIAGLAGPGPVRLVLRNNSTIAVDDLPVIRRLLERNLHGYGIIPGGTDSATLIRVTLSANLQGGLWVAEVLEGPETRVTMLPVFLTTASAAGGDPNLTLGRTLLLTQPSPVLDALIFSANGEQQLVMLEPDRIVICVRNPSSQLVAEGAASTGIGSGGWTQMQAFEIPHARPFPRDFRGRLIPARDHLFDAWLPGVLCNGSNAGAQVAIACADSDDPWPVTEAQKAFYNSLRNYFTGVLSPGFGMELAPFYDAVEIPRLSGPATLLSDVDGSVMLVENNTAVHVNGTNDWGSDLAVIHSTCGSGVQVLVSGSGAAAAGDTIRAYEISGREAVAVSSPLPIDGAVTAMGSSGGSTSATVMVRRDQPLRYEVWNVTALCN